MDKRKLIVAEDGSVVSGRLVDMGDGTYAKRVEAHPPMRLLTDNANQYARMRVDVGQTGFFAGREFRSFHEFNIPTGQTVVIKAASLVDVILYGFMVELTLSQLRVSLKSGGTEGGEFATALPILKTNQMTTASDYASQVTMSTGGTHTGGTTFDVVNLVSGSNVNKAIVQTADEDQPIGFPAGNYYIAIQNTDGSNAKGIIKFRWEERP